MDLGPDLTNRLFRICLQTTDSFYVVRIFNFIRKCFKDPIVKCFNLQCVQPVDKKAQNKDSESDMFSFHLLTKSKKPSERVGLLEMDR